MTGRRTDGRDADGDFERALKLHQEGRLTEAGTLYRAVLASAPLHSWTLHYLAVLLLQEGHSAEAQHYFRTALACDPAQPVFHGNLGEALASSDVAAAARTYRRALASDPVFSQAYGNLVARCQAVESTRMLIRFARRHSALEPASAVALSNLGLLLCQQGEFQLALPILRRAADRAPSSAQILANLGWAQASASDPVRAMETLSRAIGQDPTLVAAYNNLGRVHHKAGRNGLAMTVLRQGLALAPGQADAHANLANAALALREHEIALRHVRRSLALQPWNVRFRGNLVMTLLYLDITSAEMLEAAVAPAARPVEKKPGAVLRRRPRSQRLRVGFVSGDLFSHPVGDTLRTILEATDRNAAEVHLYANVERPDAATAGFRELADGWSLISGEDDGLVSERIRLDDLDILFSVAGHTAGGRLSLFASRMAPVQASLFDLTTTGLPSIDYWIGDAIATPLSSDEKFVEKVLRLPCWCVFRRPASAPDIAALPALTSGHLTFGCFNNPAKLSRSTVTAWAAIMRSARGSRLLLRYLHSYEEHRLRDRLVDDFERLGVAGDRIEFETSVATRTGHLGYYNRVDVALDPFPFSGCNATFEALWMGVPVVSLAGRRFLARMGASFLPHAGLPGLVAATIDEYVDVAVHLATDISALSELRQGLRGRVARSRLCDAEGYSSALFGALAEAHR